MIHERVVIVTIMIILIEFSIVRIGKLLAIYGVLRTD